MSFTLTAQQMRDCTKDVTRSLGWGFLKPGDIVMACVKCQGLGRGGKIERIHPIEIVNTEWELLHKILYNQCRSPSTKIETEREGFGHMTAIEFVYMFCEEMKCDPGDPVNRIEFKHRKDLINE